MIIVLGSDILFDCSAAKASTQESARSERSKKRALEGEGRRGLTEEAEDSRRKKARKGHEQAAKKASKEKYI